MLALNLHYFSDYIQALIFGNCWSFFGKVCLKKSFWCHSYYSMIPGGYWTLLNISIYLSAKYMLGYKLYFYKHSNHKESFHAVKINHKNLINSYVQSTASESLTVSTMQKSIMKNYRIGHQSSKRKPM